MIIGRPIVPIGGKAAKGSQLFLAVTLPPSIYYAQASEWLKIKENPKAAVAEANWDGQVVCGGHLWELYGNNAYCYSLENGELLETVALTGISGACCQGIATDGVSRIWIVRLSASVYISGLGALGTINFYRTDTMTLFEFDITTKSIKLLCSPTSTRTTPEPHYGGQNARQQNSSNYKIGYIGYSASSETVYFGNPRIDVSFQYTYYGSSSGNSTGTTYSSVTGHSLGGAAYDLMENTVSSIATYPLQYDFAGLYFYENTNHDFFYVGGGYNASLKGTHIERYNKLSNTWETVSTAFEGYTVGPFAYVDLGNKMLQISQTATGVFDPITGELDPSPVPVVPPDSTVIYPCFKAYANNILYLITQQGVYKCPFYTEVPEDAPIVCKIYKGQKYHTLEPFEIPGKISLLRTQQVADRDIEIKMYEYSSEGGQTIYIEDTGEELS